MTTTRRRFVQSTAALGALATAPGVIGRAAAQAPGRTIKAVMHGDLRSFDPHWTTANITSYHGAMVYDVLFAYDSKFRPQPQMVGKHGLSDDKLTYTFELRDGLKFSDGTPVTSADCVASLRRWAARDGAGQHMMKRVKDTPVKDDRTFQLVLSEPYGLVYDALGKISTNCLYIMRKKEADTDPHQQIKDIVGSGPFIMNAGETKAGTRYVYDKNPNYVPRSEPPDGMAGGKVVKLDRVIFENMSDQRTALSALQAGEIDFYEIPPIDLLPTIKDDRNIKIEILNKSGNIGMARLNFLHPPFNHPAARQAMLHLIKQEDILKATFGDPAFYRGCGSLFGCGNPMENDANMGWFKSGQNIEKAKELFKQAGYGPDSPPITILQATNIEFMNNAALVLAESLRKAGLKVELAASDWGGVVTRRAVKKAPKEGGWDIFITWASGHAFDSPIGLSAHSAAGDSAWFGWPKDDAHEKMRDEWAAAPTAEARLAVSRRMQDNAWNYVPMAILGQFTAPAAYRANIKGIIAIPEVIPWWNVEKG